MARLEPIKESGERAGEAATTGDPREVILGADRLMLSPSQGVEF